MQSVLGSTPTWGGYEWRVIREEPSCWEIQTDQTSNNNTLHLQGVNGSIWATEAYRRKHYYKSEADVEPAVKNIFILQSDFKLPPRISRSCCMCCFSSILPLHNRMHTTNYCFGISVQFIPKHYNAQAGILLYADDCNYVKLVVEGAKDSGTMVVFAIQINAVSRIYSPSI